MPIPIVAIIIDTQTFKEGNSTSTKFRKDYYLGELETDSKYILKTDGI